MSSDDTEATPGADPLAPLPETGRPGAEGEVGTEDQGGTGGKGGRGGRGGIGLTGLQGDPGPRGFRGQKGEGAGDQGIQGIQGETGAAGDHQSPFIKAVITLIIVITAITSYYYGHIATERLDQAQQARVTILAAQRVYAQQIACQAHLQAATIFALKARSTFTEQQAQVTKELWQSQLTLVKLLEDPNVSVQASIAGRITYEKALLFGITAVKDQLAVGDMNPFPTTDEVRACR